MSGSIKESKNSELHLQLRDPHNNLTYEDKGKNIGLEIIQEIFDYIYLSPRLADSVQDPSLSINSFIFSENKKNFAAFQILSAY